MAARFVNPVSDAEEVSLRSTAIPSNSKAATEWGIKLWNHWAGSRSKSTADIDDIVPRLPRCLKYLQLILATG